jgi:GNAT superfamily N-acetyltransferase
MRPADFEPAWRAILDGGWGDRRPALSFCLRFPLADVYVAEAGDGSIVGTSIAARHGSTGWIGLVFVAPALRGQGLGRRLTEVALQRLRELGCRSVLLAASDLGLPIYQRLGFLPFGAYTILTREAAGLEVPHHPDVRPLQPAELDAVCRLDQRVSGEDRRAAIATLGGRHGQGWVLGSADEVRGYALRTPWGLGPAVASDPAHGRLLLDVLLRHRHTAPRVSVTVPTDNHLARAHLAAHGFQEQRSLPRMVLGEPVPWRPEAMWAIFNFMLG